jgi:phosphohistidine phosphatase
VTALRQQHVILVRHANAEWPNYVGADFDRPLTPQGLADARATAAAIRDAGHRPRLLLTSPALRTMQTTEIIAATLELPDQAVLRVGELYNAAADILEAELRKALPSADMVMLVAHNPGISELARMLSGNPGFSAFRPGHWLHVGMPRV